MKKIPMSYQLAGGLAALCLVISLLVPETGSLVLLNDVCSIILMVILEVLLVKALISLVKSKNMSNTLWVLAVVVIIGWVAGIKTINTIQDAATGPVYVTIMDCDVEKRSTSRGIFSLSYYLTGTDANGSEYRLQISGEDYGYFQGRDVVSVLCYVNTGRIVDY